MTKKIEALKDKAVEAIRAVHGDMSGGHANNIEAMEEIASETETMLCALREDLARKEEGGN